MSDILSNLHLLSAVGGVMVFLMLLWLEKSIAQDIAVASGLLGGTYIFFAFCNHNGFISKITPDMENAAVLMHGWFPDIVNSVVGAVLFISIVPLALWRYRNR